MRMRSSPVMDSSVPRRRPILSITAPENSVGTSHTSRSKGSQRWPSTFLYSTTGLVTANS